MRLLNTLNFIETPFYGSGRLYENFRRSLKLLVLRWRFIAQKAPLRWFPLNFNTLSHLVDFGVHFCLPLLGSLNVKFASIFCRRRLMLNLVLILQILFVISSINSIAACNGHTSSSQLVQDERSVPQILLHSQIIDHLRLVCLHILDSLFKRKTKGVEAY